MHSVVNIHAKWRSTSWTTCSVGSTSSTAWPPSISVRQAIRRQTPSAAASGPWPETSPITAWTVPSGVLHRVVEVAAQQRAPAARAVVGGQLQAGIADQRGRQQAALEAGVLLGVQARDLELLARLVRAPALDRVAHGARQSLPVDLALDQVVLRARGDRVDAAPLVVEAGQDEHGQVHAIGLERVQRRQAVGVRQVEVQQHAVDVVEVLAPRLGERHRPHDLDVRAADREQLLDEQRVAVVVLDEQDADGR